MRRLLSYLRLLVALATLAQPMLPGVAAVLDGALAQRAGAAQPAAHIEDSTQASCPFVHHGDCGLCQYLAGTGLPTSPRATCTPVPARLAVNGEVVLASESRREALPPVRAPPRA